MSFAGVCCASRVGALPWLSAVGWSVAGLPTAGLGLLRMLASRLGAPSQANGPGPGSPWRLPAAFVAAGVAIAKGEDGDEELVPAGAILEVC